MKAVILAGGEGVRLRPLTCERPKPMLELLGRPVLEYTLAHLSGHGVDEAYLTLQYLPQKVMEYFGREQAGIRLHYALEETPLGTAGCVKQLEDRLQETFVVISGDALTDVDLTDAVRWHKEHGAAATLVLSRVDAPVEYGIVTLSQDGMVERFQEKPSWSEVFSNLANTGIYILEPSVLELIPPQGFFDFSKDLFPRLMEQGGRISGYVSQGYWCDIGSHEDYLSAQFDLLEGRCGLPIPGYQKRPGVVIASSAAIEGDAQIKGPCFIGEHCRVMPGAVVGPRAVLGDYSYVDRGASLKNTLAGRNCHLGRQSQLRGAILGDRCRVKAGAEVYEGSVAAEDTVIGAFSRLSPGARVWPGKRVEDFSHIQGAVRWGSMTLIHPLVEGSLGAEGWDELPPERIFAWGGALAAAAGARPLALSDFGGERAQAARAALQAGARCAGARVQPLLQANLPMHRFAQRALGLPLGAHVAQEGEGFRIHFIGPQGRDISREMARKLDNALKRGVEPAQRLEPPAPALAVEGLYLAQLQQLLPCGGGSAPVVVFCGDRAALAWAGRMLEGLGFAPVLVDKAPEAERPVPSGEYRAQMLEAGAGIGLRLEGYRYGLVGAQGTLYQGWKLEKLLEAAASREWSLQQLKEDGLLALIRMHHVSGGDLDPFVAAHPMEERWERTVPCPWTDRGRMVARLEGWQDFTRAEGAFVSRGEGQVSITPQDDLPLIRLAVRGLSQEASQELLSEYEKKLLEQLKEK